MNNISVLLFESGILGHLLLNDRSHAQQCVHDFPLLNLEFAEVLRLVHFVLVSIAALWFAFACSGLCSSRLPLDVLFSPAVGYALSVLLILPQDRRCISRCPLARVASLPPLTTCSLAVVPSLFLSRVTLW